MNEYRPHIYVLPEDDADRELAIGFMLHYALDARCIQVMPPSGGWPKVVEDFNNDYAKKTQANKYCHVVLLVDFDNKTSEDTTNRFNTIRQKLIAHQSERVFIIGAWSDPQRLTEALGMTRESIGLSLASECERGTSDLWNHELLRHNLSELSRMTSFLKPFLFSGN